MNPLTRFMRERHQQVATFFLLLNVVLFPILVLPLGTSFLSDSKHILLLVITIVIAAWWTLNSFIRKTLQFTFSPFLFPLVLFSFSVICSVIINRENYQQHLFGAGGFYLAIASLFIFGSSLVKRTNSRVFLNVLLVPTIILAIGSLTERLHIGPSRVVDFFFQTKIADNPIFSLAGNTLIAAELFSVVLVGTVATALTQKEKVLKSLYSIVALFLSATLFLTVQSLLQVRDLQSLTLPFDASYQVAANTFKSSSATIFGVGPENYLHSYLRYKPVALNTTALWNTPFTQGSSFPFTVIVTLGLFGLIAWIILFIQVGRNVLSSRQENLPIALMVMTILLITTFLPIDTVIMMLLSFSLIFWVAAEKNKLKDVQLHAFTVQIAQADGQTERTPKHSNLIVYIVSTLSVVGILFAGYWTWRLTQSYWFSFQADVVATSSNLPAGEKLSLIQSYQKRAIEAIPYSDFYRRRYSATNTFIAVQLFNNANNNKEEYQKATFFLEQAIQEANVAVRLNPQNTANWFTLAQVWSTLIEVEPERARNMVGNAYLRAIEVAPNDPVAYLELGGIFYRAQNYPQSSQLYEKAVALKPDWAVASFNLANSYKQEKRFEMALAAYNQTLTLVANNPEASNQVVSEIESIQKALQDQKNPQGQRTPPRSPQVQQPRPVLNNTPLLNTTDSASTTDQVPKEAKDVVKDIGNN